MNIHYSRCGGLNYPGLSPHIGLYARRFFLTDEPSRDADFLCVFVHIQTCLPFNIVLGHDPFLCVPVWDLFFGAVGVEFVFAGDAKAGFEGVGGVVYACMDDLYSVSLDIVQGSGRWKHTSEFRLLVSVPTASCFSSKIVLVPSRAASWRAIARPTTPPPITCLMPPCQYDK